MQNFVPTLVLYTNKSCTKNCLYYNSKRICVNHVCVIILLVYFVDFVILLLLWHSLFYRLIVLLKFYWLVYTFIFFYFFVYYVKWYFPHIVIRLCSVYEPEKNYVYIFKNLWSNDIKTININVNTFDQHHNILVLCCNDFVYRK